MNLTIKRKLILHSCTLVFIMVLMSVLASAYLSHKQITNQNLSRLKSAEIQFERIILQDIAKLDKKFHEFSNKTDTAKILLNCIQQDYFYFPSVPELFNLGPALELEHFAFYFPTRFAGPFRLQIYFDKTLDGLVRVRGETHTLFTFGADFQEKELSAIGNHTENYHQNITYAIHSNSKDIQIISHLEYANPADASEFGSTFEKGATIGYFIMKKNLTVDLATLDREMGVNVNLYDHQGKLIGGVIEMPDISSISQTGMVNLADKNKQEYDSVLKPVIYGGNTIGYVSFSISQAATTAKILETVKILFAIGIGVVSIGILFSFFIHQGIVRPINHVVHLVRNISEGDLEDILMPNSERKDEIGILLNAFGRMVVSMRETADAAEAIASGNLTVEVRERSEQDRMMKALNRMIQKLNDIKNETDTMIQAVGQGRLDIQGNAESFEGGWRDLVTGVNNLIVGLSNAVIKTASLDMEMELAKRIQTVLLPEKPKIPGYDIAAVCIPADEVGGDYYDVISVAGYDWIVVGDVSGHGIAAGLVMMMVQTAIHTIILENPSVPPSCLLSAVNRTIYENIEKMKESKHMTIVVLAAGRDGVFSFSGLHEDILIRRAETGKVEKVETDGMWIGLEPEISERLSTDTLKLEPGDCMILYTDGITEAHRESDKEMFGDERLTEIIEKYGWKSASEIHFDIMKAIDQYEKLDDVTLFVMRRYPK